MISQILRRKMYSSGLEPRLASLVDKDSYHSDWLAQKSGNGKSPKKRRLKQLEIE